MKKITAILAIGLVSIAGLTGCGGGYGEEEEPNPPTVETDGYSDLEEIYIPSVGVNILVFDIERDGRTLTCTTKDTYTSGVSCIPAAPQ